MKLSAHIVCRCLLFFALCFIILIYPASRVLSSGSTSLFLETLPEQVTQGENVIVNVKINSKEQPINAVSGVISFPANLVSLVSLNKNNSIIKLWTQEPTSSSNKISFEGVILTPGFQGSSGQILQITFRAKNKGIVALNWNEGSILANDGYGTNVLDSLYSTNFKIVSTPVNIQNKTPNTLVATPPTKETMNPPAQNIPVINPPEQVSPVAPVPVVVTHFMKFEEEFLPTIRNWDSYLSNKIIAFEDSLVKYIENNLLFTTLIAFFVLLLFSLTRMKKEGNPQ